MYNYIVIIQNPLSWQRLLFSNHQAIQSHVGVTCIWQTCLFSPWACFCWRREFRNWCHGTVLFISCISCGLVTQEQRVSSSLRLLGASPKAGKCRPPLAAAFPLTAGCVGATVSEEHSVGEENWCQLSRARKLIQGTISSKVNGRTDLQHSINWIKLKAISYALVAITRPRSARQHWWCFTTLSQWLLSIRKEKQVCQFHF